MYWMVLGTTIFWLMSWLVLFWGGWAGDSLLCRIWLLFVEAKVIQWVDKAWWVQWKTSCVFIINILICNWPTEWISSSTSHQNLMQKTRQFTGWLERWRRRAMVVRDCRLKPGQRRCLRKMTIFHQWVI